MGNLVGGVTEAQVQHVGLSPEERAALEGDDTDVQHDAGRLSADETARLEKEMKEGKDDEVGDAAAKEAVAKEAAEKAAADKAAAEKLAAEKAEAERKAAREAELAAMDEAARAKAEADDRAKEVAAAAERLEAERVAKEAEERKAAEKAASEEPLVATYQAPAVEDYDKKVGAIDTKVAEAEAKFKAGDLTFDEFRKQERTLQDERRELDEARLKHEISSESTTQAAEARWKWECDRFFKDTAAADGLDYKDPKNRPLWAALDAEVKTLGKDDKNAEKPGTWFLQEAHKRVMEAANIQRRAPSEEDKKKAAERKAADERKAGKPDAVRTLHGLPDAGSDKPDVKGEFAHLDSLEGMELETALAKMSKDDADRYLQGK